jgi:hypothetical protein
MDILFLLVPLSVLLALGVMGVLAIVVLLTWQLRG